MNEKKQLNDKEVSFLIGLGKLTRETGIAIAGCGCCGSPFLVEASITSQLSGYGCCSGQGEITWIDPNDSYDWENCSRNIVKPTPS